ncbi:MAG: MASE3 domain-containing protein [Dehalogenimonas sp.]|uniref:Oxygen sensor histidine kinase NreB n=1 Tax=Candidatus Dehalogenimonas loeffleri TaxID=3127115 RepID=A0ABZ2J6Y4_9CHLR|nr:MASE3 domain-containing protein [Dehalogenimonas sp.]
MNNFLGFKSPAIVIIISFLAFIGLYLLSQVDYLLFHSFIELFGVVVAFSVFIIAWNARKFLDNDYLLLIGIGFLFVSLLNAFHTLSYRGMGVFQDFEPTNLAAQFWIAARYLQALTLLSATRYLSRRLKIGPAFGAYALTTSLIITSILIWPIFPATFTPENGLTAFKIISEFIISGILLGAIILLYKKRGQFSGNVFRYLIIAMGVNISSEMTLTLYADAYGLMNTLGHSLLVVSYYFIYKALIETGISRPFSILFHNLKKSEERFENRAKELALINDRLIQEISTRKQIEATLTQTREDLNRAQTVGHIGSWRLDVQKDVLSWSDENHRIFGIPKGIPLTYETFLGTIHSDDRQHVDGCWKAALKGEPYDIEHRIIVEGREKWVREKAFLETNDSGELLGGFGITEDITERKMQEKALRESEGKYRDLFTTMTEAFALHEIIVDEAGTPIDYRFIEVNAAFEETTGLKAGDVIGKNVREVIPGIESSWIETYGKVAVSGIPVTFENYSTSIGKWYQVKAYSPAPGRFATIFYDTTERKVNEEKLRQAAQEWQATFDSINDAVILLDSRHCIVRANQAFGRIFNISPAEAVGRLCHDIVHNSARPHAICPHARTMASGRTVSEELFEPKLDIYVEATTSPIIDQEGRCIGTVHIIKDINRRKTVEAERENLLMLLEKQHLLLQNTIDQLPSGVILRDTEGSLLMTNSEIVNIFGQIPENISRFEALCCFHSDGRQYATSDWPMYRTVKNGETVTNEEILVTREGKDPITVMGATTPVRNKNNEIIANVGIFTNITNRKQAEQLLQNMTSELEARIKERTRELVSAHDKLLEQLEYRAKAEASLRSLSNRLLSAQEQEKRAIARELHDQTGQSLTVVKLLLGKAEQVATEELRPVLKEISNTITEIIKQVRNLSLSLRPGILDDLGLIPALEWQFKQLKEQAELKVIFHHDNLPELSAEMNIGIFRIIQEALTNVLRYAGVLEAEVKIMVKDSAIMLYISDRGKGFSAAELSAGSSTGLSAMRERATLLGGQFSVNSNTGQGTVVTVKLPLREFQ